MSKQTKQVIDSSVDPIIVQMKALTTKSSKIRFLHANNKTRSEIVKILSEEYKKKILYQHVRNVLITPIKTEKK